MEDYEALERARKDALTRWDPLKYFELCNKLGVVLEDETLYEQGEVEAQHREIESRLEKELAELETPKPKKRRTKQKGKYMRFLEDVRVNSKSPRLLIQQYFPSRYHKQGMDNYSDSQIVFILRRIVHYAKELEAESQ